MNTKQSYDIVKLNVGGVRYETFRSTLLSKPDTFFIGMLQCKSETEYFIDRDGKKFEAVLNYLRGAASLSTVDPIEADFYALAYPPNKLRKLMEKDREEARKYVFKYGETITNEISLLYESTHRKDSNLNLFINRTSLMNEPEWKTVFRSDFPPLSPLFGALAQEIRIYYASQGISCEVRYTVASKSNVTPGQKSLFLF
jgi:hypothetical protein